MTLGNLTAIRQTNIKRMLAYSSIAQAGYILIGVAAAERRPRRPQSPFGGINGVLIYLLAYLVTNVGAFASVIAIENRSGKVEIKDYAGPDPPRALAGVTALHLPPVAGRHPADGRLHRQAVRLRRRRAGADAPAGRGRRAECGGFRVLLSECRAGTCSSCLPRRMPSRSLWSGRLQVAVLLTAALDPADRPLPRAADRLGDAVGAAAGFALIAN